MWMSLAVSPSSRRLTGMPVHAADDLGDVVGVDLLLEQRARALERGERRLLLGEPVGELRLACRT